METLLEKVISLDHRIKGGGQRWRNTDEHSSLVLDLQEQVWYWNSKALSGKPIDYLILVKKLTRKQAEDIIKDLSGVSFETTSKRTKVTPPTPNERLVNIFWENGKTDRGYWYKRVLTDSTIDLYRLGKYDGLYMIPIYYKDKFMNFQCRKDEPKKVIVPWYRGVGPLLYNSNILSLINTVFITEGVVDSILLNQLGYPAVSHTGGAYGWSNDWFSLFTGIKRIYYVADNDEVGKKASFKVAKCLGEHKVKIIMFDGFPDKTDFVSYLRDYGGTINGFNSLIDNSKHTFEIRN